MLHAHRRFAILNKSNELILVRLFLAIGMACLDTIWALYMNSFGFSESAIGFISAGFVIVTLYVALISPAFLQRVKLGRLLKYSLLLSILAFVTIGLFKNIFVFVAMVIVLSVSGVFRSSCFNIIFRDNTTNGNLNKDEGFLYTVINVGWLLGPLIAGFF